MPSLTKDHGPRTARSSDRSPDPGASIADVVTSLRTARDGWRARQDEARDVAGFPSSATLEHVVELLSAALYPGARSTICGNVWLLSDVAADGEIAQPEARSPVSSTRASTPVRGH